MKSIQYKDAANLEQELIKQPSWSDAMADAFNAAGSAPVVKPGDFEANAALLGMGAGFKGAANERRAAQLQPMLEQAGRITAKAAEIEAQIQQAQSYQLAINEFGQKYTPLVAEFAAAVNSNDPRATMMFKDLINKAQMIPGFENLEGDSWNPSGGFGLALNTQTGEYRKITADEIVSAVAPAAQTIYGDQWFEKFMPLNAGFAKDAAYAFNMKRQEDALGLEGKRADVNLKQAHAGVYQQQANQIQNEMQAPRPKYDDKTLTHNRTQNSDWVNSLYKKHKDLRGVIKAQTEIKDAIQKEIDNNSWNTGSSFFAELTRWANEKSGDNQTQQLIALKRQPLFKELKNIFPTRITDVDLATWLTTQVDLSTDPKLAISELDSRIKESQDEIKEEEIRREVLENDFGNSEPYNSLLVDQKVQEKVKSNTGMVTMTGPAGTIKVPADKVELFKANGYQ